MSQQNDRVRKLLEDADSARLLAVFAQANQEIRFIGGCVRDTFLKRDIKDIDFATTALPGETIAILQKNAIQAVPTGIAHGTVTAVLSGKVFEITTLRADIETDGRHAEVSFTKDWQTDAQRRDFTINALSVDADGHLHDYMNGENDLNEKRLRFIGDPAIRIQEDYLRILRYFRFASQLGWKINDDKALAVCSAYASHLKKLSRERIQAELFKLLTGPGCINIVLAMKNCGIWRGFIDSPVDIDGFGNLVYLENKYNEPDAFRRFIGLIGFKNDEQIEKIAALSNKEKKRIHDIRGMDQYHADGRSLVRQLYDYGADIVKDYYYLLNQDKHFAAIDAWKKPIFPVTATDILPFTKGEGPLVGTVLTALENYWVDHGFETTKNELITIGKQFIEAEAH